MATPATTSKVLNPEDLAARWNGDLTYVWDEVDSQENSLPFLYFGRGTPSRGHKNRVMYRFRLSDVEAWEASQVRSFRTRTETEEQDAVAALATFGHDGKIRGGRKGKAGPRGKK